VPPEGREQEQGAKNCLKGTASIDCAAAVRVVAWLIHVSMQSLCELTLTHRKR